MASFPPKKNTAFAFYVSLVSQANTKIMQANPTLAAGDVKVAVDDAAPANLTTLPVVDADFTKRVKVAMSAAEMNGDRITVIFSDAAGAEWCDLTLDIPTSVRQTDDLAFPAISGRSMVVDAAGLVDANTVKLGPTGAGTAQTAKDVGGAVPAVAAGASGGLLISGSNAGTTTLGALTITGVTTHTGNVVLSDGLTISAPSTLNRAGLDIAGNGTGAGIKTTGGATGHGFNIVGGGTSGDGIKITTTSGHGINSAPVGTSMHGILATGGNVGTSDGIKAVAGTGGVDVRGNITGNLSGSVNSVTSDVGITQAGADKAWSTAARTLTAATNITSTGGTTVPQTGDSFARIGAPAGASVSADIAALQADLPQRVTKNVALAAFPFFMYDSADHVSGKTGLTITATRSIDGAAFAACANLATEIANGWYKIDLAASDLNGNTIALKFTATGADQQNITIVTEPT